MNPVPPPPTPDERNEPTPLNSPDQVASWLLGDSSGVSPDAAGRLLADQPGLRRPVADRLFVHGLLTSLYDMADGGAARRRRVDRVVAGLAEPVAKPQPALIFRLPWLRSGLVAAGVLLAVGIGLFGLPGQTGKTGGGFGGAEANATEVLAKAARSVSSDEIDREYRISILDEAETEIRGQRLFIRGKRWALKLDERWGAWVGSDGAKDWMTTPFGRTPPEWAIRARTGYVRGLLNVAEVQHEGLSGVIEELSKTGQVRFGERGEAPGKPGTDCIHLWGERGLRLQRIDIWADAATGVPQRVELQVNPPNPYNRARRLIFEYQGDPRLDPGFYSEKGVRKV